MNIQERINYFSGNMSLNFFIKNYVKMELLDKEINRVVKKELKGERRLSFTSQDLRTYTIALEKVHKILNKKISFVEFTKKIERHKRVDTKVMNDETKNLAQYIYAARQAQMLVSLTNYWATIVYMLELEHQQREQESDEIFNLEILSGLLEIF